MKYLFIFLLFFVSGCVTTSQIREQYRQTNPNSKYWSQIDKEQITMGMNTDEVRASWGEPIEKSNYTINFNYVEVWTYNVPGYDMNAEIIFGVNFKHRYLVFDRNQTLINYSEY